MQNQNWRRVIVVAIAVVSVVSFMTAAQAQLPLDQSARRQFRQILSSRHSATSIQAASTTWLRGTFCGRMKAPSSARMEPMKTSRSAPIHTSKPTEQR